MSFLNLSLFSKRLNAEGSMPRLHWLNSSNFFANSALLLGNKSIVKIAFGKWSDVGLVPFGCPGFLQLRGRAVSPCQKPWPKMKEKPPMQWGAKETRGPSAQSTYLLGLLLCLKFLPLASLAWIKPESKCESIRWRWEHTDELWSMFHINTDSFIHVLRESETKRNGVQRDIMRGESNSPKSHVWNYLLRGTCLWCNLEGKNGVGRWARPHVNIGKQRKIWRTRSREKRKDWERVGMDVLAFQCVRQSLPYSFLWSFAKSLPIL